MEDHIRGGSGVIVTRFNYHRPKWFGGFFGAPNTHNHSGFCSYDAEEMKRLITP